MQNGVQKKEKEKQRMFCRIVKYDVCWANHVERRNWTEKIAEFSCSLNIRMELIMTSLNGRLPKERELLYGSLRKVAEQPRWHALAVRDAAPLLRVFNALDYVGSLELALDAIAKQNAALRASVLDLVSL